MFFTLYTVETYKIYKRVYTNVYTIEKSGIGIIRGLICITFQKTHEKKLAVLYGRTSIVLMSLQGPRVQIVAELYAHTHSLFGNNVYYVS